MKKIWVNASPWNKEIVTAALESGADAVKVPKGYSTMARRLGLIKTISPDGDIKTGREVIEIDIKTKADEERAIVEGRSKSVIIRASDWKIIPLENIIAQTKGIIAEVSNYKEAKTALGILEKGVDGIFVNTKKISEIKKTVALVKNVAPDLKLSNAKIVSVKSLGMGDRVCIDTCTEMKKGEGVLVGNSSDAMFLVHSESIHNPYVSPRPFRVNAGAVHAYTLVSENKTKYLSEIQAGDEVVIINHKGKTQNAIVGRAKVEKRPLMLVEACSGKKRFSVILQNAETIRLVDPKGRPVSIVKLKRGSQVLSYICEAGRHFGIKVEESIEER